MTSSRSFERGASSLKRRKPRVPSSGKAFLLVTEGEKTEPNYFLALRDRLHLSTADITIVHPSGTDPKTLVEEALRLRNKRMEEAKSGWAIAYDEVWVVFDLEAVNHPRRKQYKGAMELGRSKGRQLRLLGPMFRVLASFAREIYNRPF